MSVIEAIAPIYSSDIIVGYLMLGQVLTDNKDGVRSRARSVCEELGAFLDEKLIDEITVADDAYISSAVNMMSMCANYLYTNEIIRDKPDVFVYQLKQYIRANLDGDLSVGAICRHFYISTTKLYVTSRDNFGMGISDYVRCERIKKAKRLLVNTDLSVAQVGCAVGIKDANYFVRTFKQSERVTPLAYRTHKRTK